MIAADSQSVPMYKIARTGDRPPRSFAAHARRLRLRAPLRNDLTDQRFQLTIQLSQLLLKTPDHLRDPAPHNVDSVPTPISFGHHHHLQASSAGKQRRQLAGLNIRLHSLLGFQRFRMVREDLDSARGSRRRCRQSSQVGP
jgi:hypothetical protein